MCETDERSGFLLDMVKCLSYVFACHALIVSGPWLWRKACKIVRLNRVALLCEI